MGTIFSCYGTRTTGSSRRGNSSASLDQGLQRNEFANVRHSRNTIRELCHSQNSVENTQVKREKNQIYQVCWLRLVVLLVGSTALTVVAYLLLVRGAAYQDLPLRTPPPVTLSSQYELELYRGDERTSEGNTARPFRNSQLLLLNTETGSKKAFLARGRSTAKYRPLPEDIESYFKKHSQDAEIRWGFMELPPGTYWCKAGSFKNEIGFQISGAGWTGDSIFTSNSQTIRYTPVKWDKASTPYLDIENERQLPPISVRTDCWIHGSITKNWSHRDSLGCVTLQKASSQEKRTGIMSDWENFVNEMTKAGLANTDSPAVKLKIIDTVSTAVVQ